MTTEDAPLRESRYSLTPTLSLAAGQVMRVERVVVSLLVSRASSGQVSASSSRATPASGSGFPQALTRLERWVLGPLESLQDTQCK
ncbi:MAG: hypothetical protein GY822_06000 [Deltaproteobacteria bacterium]|nr:hypothetical protein [Deltaproteobacteria bacterium]